jgi:hypothetical protein
MPGAMQRISCFSVAQPDNSGLLRLGRFVARPLQQRTAVLAHTAAAVRSQADVDSHLLYQSQWQACTSAIPAPAISGLTAAVQPDRQTECWVVAGKAAYEIASRLSGRAPLQASSGASTISCSIGLQIARQLIEKPSFVHTLSAQVGSASPAEARTGGRGIAVWAVLRTAAIEKPSASFCTVDHGDLDASVRRRADAPVDMDRWAAVRGGMAMQCRRVVICLPGVLLAFHPANCLAE